MKNYKLHIQYDGTNYAGWQIQKDIETVQGKITDVIEMLLKEKVNLLGSGRTDSGVHAIGQVANFRTENKLDIEKFRYSLNSILPDDISIKSINETHVDFHSRFDAKERSYLYFISKDKSPFYDKYSLRNRNVFEFDVTKLNKISKSLLGEHDFTSLSRKNSEVKNKICIVNNIYWRKTKDQLIFYISANRFLHGMVRTIVGTIIYCINNNLDEKYILEILEKKEREVAPKAVVGKGLFLFKVRY